MLDRIGFEECQSSFDRFNEGSQRDNMGRNMLIYLVLFVGRTDPFPPYVPCEVLADGNIFYVFMGTFTSL